MIVDVRLSIVKNNDKMYEILDFTNVDMETVKKAIDLLNGEATTIAPTLSTEDLDVCLIALRQAWEREQSLTAQLRIRRVLNSLLAMVGQDEASITDMPIRPSIGEYTVNELFPTINSVCSECGVSVVAHEVHTRWHNKLLP